MIVVADTSALNYLLLMGEVDLLPALYDKILIPTEVHRELQRERAPVVVRSWASALPAWCEVHEAVANPGPNLSSLDEGERQAIHLALNFAIDTLLMDDWEGRREAERYHLTVVGTLSLLEQASRKGLIDFKSALQRLEATNFRLSAKLRDEFLKRNS